ncbi:MAG: protein kinase [Streptosporangiales bacterium]|nr:protein kinase [Streptosporangiales bacterium]
MSGGGRWYGHRSEFPWEQAALDHIREQMPDAEPYRAWQTFMFTTGRGHVREVDLLLASPAGLFLVEIKSHPGTVTNAGDTWMFRDKGITRTIDNPLSLTDHKAKELKGLLKRAARARGVTERIPFIRPAVFLSAENLVCELNEFQRAAVYGRDGLEDQTDLPGIWYGLLDEETAGGRTEVTPGFSRALPGLLTEIGIANMQRIGTVGPYELDQRSFGAGPAWADYLARNPALPDDQPRRVRVYLTERIDSAGEAASVRRAAYREYMALQGISHEGIVRADDYSEELLAGPAVVFRHGSAWQRLDHFITGGTGTGCGLPAEARLDMVRQLAEALDHAHRRHLYHRALAPQSVYVETDGSCPQLRIADWQVAAQADSGADGGPGYDPEVFLKLLGRSAGAYLAPEFGQAGVSAAGLDLFGLGALTSLVLTEEPPAADRDGLLARIEADGALTVPPLAPLPAGGTPTPEVRELIRSATRRDPAGRTQTVREFMRQLDLVEEALAARTRLGEKDPLDAVRGDVIEGWTVRGVLGKGSTSKSLLVRGTPVPGGPAEQRVLRIALDGEAAARVRREAELLCTLNDSHVIRILDGPFEAGPPRARRTMIAVEYANGDHLSEELRRHGPVMPRELEGLGEDLFAALRFLDHRGIWHRDVKPDNLVLRTLPRGGSELVMIDFALSGVPDDDLTVGTPGYRDPYLGGPGRPCFDQAAQLYAAAVTLHEMASGELPERDDRDPAAEARLATSRFDPPVRDGLAGFFRTALDPDVTRRFRDLHAMTVAWTDIFRTA